MIKGTEEKLFNNSWSRFGIIRKIPEIKIKGKLTVIISKLSVIRTIVRSLIIAHVIPA